MKKPKKPSIPQERHETIRRSIQEALRGRTLSAKDLSSEVGIPEKEVWGHLEHVRKTLNKKEHHLAVTPAECKKCGFVFRKRERLSKPGKCPVCKSQAIHEPTFSIHNV